MPVVLGERRKYVFLDEPYREQLLERQVERLGDCCIYVGGELMKHSQTFNVRRKNLKLHTEDLGKYATPEEGRIGGMTILGVKYPSNEFSTTIYYYYAIGKIVGANEYDENIFTPIGQLLRKQR